MNRLLFVMLFLMAVNAFTQGASCRYGNSLDIKPMLANLPEALKALGKSLH